MNNRQLKKNKLKKAENTLDRFGEYVSSQEIEDSPDNPEMKIFKQTIIFIFIIIMAIAGAVAFTFAILYMRRFAKGVSFWNLLRISTEILTVAITFISICYLIKEYREINKDVKDYHLELQALPVKIMIWFLLAQACIMLTFIIKDCIVPLIYSIASSSNMHLQESAMNAAVQPTIMSSLMLLAILIADWIRNARKSAVINFASFALAIVSLLISVVS